MFMFLLISSETSLSSQQPHNTSLYTAALVAVLPPAKMPIRFVHASNGQLPPDADIGGHDNGPQYIARSYHEGKFVPHQVA